MYGTNELVVGENNIAGIKGFYYKAIDTTNKKIYLTLTQPTVQDQSHYVRHIESNPVYHFKIASGFFDFPYIGAYNEAYNDLYTGDTSIAEYLTDIIKTKLIGKYITLVNTNKVTGMRCCKVKSITGSVIEYEGEVSTFATEESRFKYTIYPYSSTDNCIKFEYDDYSVVFPECPDIGLLCTVSKNSYAIGTNCNSIGRESFSIGKQCIAEGNYSFAQGNKSNAIGYNSISLGKNSTVNNNYSFCWNGNGDTPYTSKGEGTFCINPVNGINSIFIGSSYLSALVCSYVNVKCSIPTDSSTEITNGSATVTITMYAGNELNSNTIIGSVTLSKSKLNHTFTIPCKTEYFVKVTSCSDTVFCGISYHNIAKTNSTLEFVVNRIAEISTFGHIKEVLNSGFSISKLLRLLVGKTIVDKWISDDGITEYEDPMICVDVKEYIGEDNKPHVGAKMRRKYATLNFMPFDNSEQLSVTRYIPDCQNIVRHKTNTTDILTVIGNNFSTFFNINGSRKLTSTYDYFACSELDYSLSTFTYGNNRYEYSIVRLYLNSSAEKGKWWSSQHVGLCSPDLTKTSVTEYKLLTDKRGYMAGCSENLLAVVKPVKISCKSNNYNYNSKVYDLCDKFFIDSVTEVLGVGNSGEGTADLYWSLDGSVKSNNTISKRIPKAIEDHTTQRLVWLRSAFNSTTCNVWRIPDGGQCYSDKTANAVCRMMPCCVIY